MACTPSTASAVPARAALLGQLVAHGLRAPRRPGRGEAWPASTPRPAARPRRSACGHLEGGRELVAGRRPPAGRCRCAPPRPRATRRPVSRRSAARPGPDGARQRRCSGRSRDGCRGGRSWPGTSRAPRPRTGRRPGPGRTRHRWPRPARRPPAARGSRRPAPPARRRRAVRVSKPPCVGGVGGVAGAEVGPGAERPALGAHHGGPGPPVRSLRTASASGAQHGLGEQVVGRPAQGDDGDVAVVVAPRRRRRRRRRALASDRRRGVVRAIDAATGVPGTTLGRAGGPGGP